MNVQVYGENHMSENDTDEEIKYIKNKSYDFIVYESESGDIPEGYINKFYHYVFSLPLLLLTFFRIYDNNSDLTNIIEKSDSELIHTRESNSIFYEYRPFLTHILFVSFLSFLFSPIVSFIFIENRIISILIVLLFSILYFLSFYVLLEKTDDCREKEIARKIDNLPENSSVLVITGNKHKKGIINKIETDNVDVLDNK